MTIILLDGRYTNDFDLQYEVNPNHHITYTEHWVIVVDEKQHDVARFNRHYVVTIYEDKYRKS
jgi:hypothetical protein